MWTGVYLGRERFTAQRSIHQRGEVLHRPVQGRRSRLSLGTIVPRYVGVPCLGTSALRAPVPSWVSWSEHAPKPPTAQTAAR